MLPDEPEDPPDDGPISEPEPPERTFDGSNPTQVRERTKRAKVLADQRGDFWRAVLSSELGRMVMWETIHSLGGLEDRFATTPGGGNCPELTWLNAGEQRAGFRIYRTLLKHDPKQVYQMHLENDPSYAQPKPRRTRKD